MEILLLDYLMFGEMFRVKCKCRTLKDETHFRADPGLTELAIYTQQVAILIQKHQCVQVGGDKTYAFSKGKQHSDGNDVDSTDSGLIVIS